MKESRALLTTIEVCSTLTGHYYQLKADDKLKMAPLFPEVPSSSRAGISCNGKVCCLLVLVYTLAIFLIILSV